ncbi:branched-chain amino acid ABC transporter permease [bacterium]|nr:MAG: branched-chain amino acid ABC transporter permease [bacterium]
MKGFWPVRVASIIGAILLCFLLEKLGRGMDSFTQQLIVFAGLYVTLSVSLNLINGITGQFSIGHAAFYQVGAYTSAYLGARFYHGQSMIVWLLMMAVGGAIAAAISGIVVGLPSLRLKGDYLAIVTLGFGEIVRIVIQNQESLGGSGGIDVKPHAVPQPIMLVALLAVLCVAVCRNLLKTAHGLPFLAVREDEVASSAMGVNVTWVKVIAFVVGSAFAGAAGAIYGNSLGAINPQLFTSFVSITILSMVVLGGTGSITGSVIAAIALFYIPELMRDIKDVRMSLIVGGLIALGLAVSAIRYVLNHVHKPAAVRAAYHAGIIVGAIVLAEIFAAILGNVGPFKGTVEGAKLRLVVSALVLIVLMLVRPQGIFAHHEFSWSWIGKLLGKRTPTKEIAA